MSWTAETVAGVIRRVRIGFDDVDPEIPALPYWTYFELLNRALSYLYESVGTIPGANTNQYELMTFTDGTDESAAFTNIGVNFEAIEIVDVICTTDGLGTRIKRGEFSELHAINLARPSQKSPVPSEWAPMWSDNALSAIKITPFAKGTVKLAVFMRPLEYDTLLSHYPGSTTGPANAESTLIGNATRLFTDAVVDELSLQAAIAMTTEARNRLGIDAVRLDRLTKNAERSRQAARDQFLASFHQSSMDMRRH